jgi:DNA-binding response OmpR family regulator
VNDGNRTTVLVVDDKPDLVTAHATALEETYDVHTATGGAEALEQIDDSVDMVFLDRRMPEMTGREVLEELRERGYDVPVSMVTAVEADVDIIEMPFDDYVTKPVDGPQLREQVELLTKRERYVELSRELYSLTQKRKSLEASGNDEANRDEYQELLERIETLKTERDEDWLTVQEY